MIEERTEEEMMEEILFKQREMNICTLQHPVNKNLIMMSTCDATGCTSDILQDKKKELLVKLLTNMESEYIDQNIPSEEGRAAAKQMVPSAFVPLREMPPELKEAVVTSLNSYGEDETYVMLRFFQHEKYDDGEGYIPVLVDIKNGQFVGTEEDEDDEHEHDEDDTEDVQ